MSTLDEIRDRHRRWSRSNKRKGGAARIEPNARRAAADRALLLAIVASAQAALERVQEPSDDVLDALRVVRGESLFDRGFAERTRRQLAALGWTPTAGGPT